MKEKTKQYYTLFCPAKRAEDMRKAIMESPYDIISMYSKSDSKNKIILWVFELNVLYDEKNIKNNMILKKLSDLEGKYLKEMKDNIV